MYQHVSRGYDVLSTKYSAFLALDLLLCYLLFILHGGCALLLQKENNCRPGPCRYRTVAIQIGGPSWSWWGGWGCARRRRTIAVPRWASSSNLFGTISVHAEMQCNECNVEMQWLSRARGPTHSRTGGVTVIKTNRKLKILFCSMPAHTSRKRGVSHFLLPCIWRW